MALRFDGDGLLARLRGEGRNLTWFCGQVGVSRHTFYRWLWRTRVPSEAHVARMAEILGCAREALFLPEELPDGSLSLPSGNDFEYHRPLVIDGDLVCELPR